MGKDKRYLDGPEEVTIESKIDAIQPEEITEEIPAEVESNGPETKNGTIVNSLFVKLRKEPSYASDAVDVLRKGDKVVIAGKENGFYKVSTSSNKSGYISSDFIEEE